jgi:hypothetical protein
MLIQELFVTSELQFYSSYCSLRLAIVEYFMSVMCDRGCAGHHHAVHVLCQSCLVWWQLSDIVCCMDHA